MRNTLALLFFPLLLTAQRFDPGLREAFIPYRLQDKWGYCGPDKSLRIPVRYEEAGFFRGGYAVVKQEGGRHLIDTAGGRLTGRPYSRIVFREGLGYELWDSAAVAPVYAIVTEGRLQPLGLPPEPLPDSLPAEEAARPLAAPVLNGVYREGGKYGFRSGRAIPDPRTGELQYDWDFLIPPKYDSLLVLGPNQLLALEGGKWGMVGPDDELLLEKEYEHIGWVAFWGSRAYLVKRAGKWGIISRTFQPLMPIQYDTLVLEGQFIIGAAGGRWGTFNSYGQPIIPLQYDSLFYLFPRFKWFAARKGGLWGVIDEKEKPAFPFQYLGIKHFTGDFLIARDSLGWGLVDAKNQWALPAGYDDIGLSVVAGAPQFTAFLLDKGGRKGFYCPEAGKMIPPRYLAFHGFDTNNLARVETEGGPGYVSWDGVEYFED